jgi:hypothetical protein
LVLLACIENHNPFVGRGACVCEEENALLVPASPCARQSWSTTATALAQVFRRAKHVLLKDSILISFGRTMLFSFLHLKAV